jgi:hypothetical protein
MQTTRWEATRRAEAVLRKCPGTRWAIVIWAVETAGLYVSPREKKWAFRVQNGGLSVYENRFGGKPTYSCLLNGEDEASGSGSVYWHKKSTGHKTPAAAIAARMKAAREFLDTVTFTVLRIEKHLRENGGAAKLERARKGKKSRAGG